MGLCWDGWWESGNWTALSRSQRECVCRLATAALQDTNRDAEHV